MINETNSSVANEVVNVVKRVDFDIFSKLVMWVNDFFYRILDTHFFTVPLLVLVFSLVFKRKYHENWFMTALVALVLWGFLKWAGFGGVAE